MMLKASVSGTNTLGGRVRGASRLAGFDKALEDAAAIIAAEADREFEAAAARKEHNRNRPAVMLSSAPDGRAVRIGTPDPLGRVLEFGTLRRPPRPWLLPAFRAALRPATARLAAWLATLWR